MRISIFSITSLLISAAAFVLYAILLDGTNVFIPWIILSVLAMVFPLLSKYFRKRKQKKGTGFEIAALVIGAFDFYFIFFAATKINLFFVFILIAVICILYVKLFNNVIVTQKAENNEILVQNELQKMDKSTQPTTRLKASLITAIVSTLFIPILIVVHILAEEAYVDNDVFYIINDSMAFFILPAICVVSLIIFIYNKVKGNSSSIRYREKCYKKVAKMKEYMDKGIITEEEFEKNKQDILKNIKL